VQPTYPNPKAGENYSESVDPLENTWITGDAIDDTECNGDDRTDESENPIFLTP
jgi:hypothetical protein